MLAQGASEKNLQHNVSMERRQVYSFLQLVFHSIYTKVAFVMSVLGTLFIATVMRGEHLTFMAYTKRWMEAERNTSQVEPLYDDGDPWNVYLAPYRLQNLHWFMLGASVAPLMSFFLFAGTLVTYYNIMQRENPKDWKCQPKRFNTFKQMLGGFSCSCMNMTIGGLLSGTIACYIVNGGYTTLYFDVFERGILYLVLSAVGLFILLEGSAYYLHLLYHIPWLYRTIHKWHHWYQYPSAVHAIVFHPIEFITFQALLAFPPFIFPLHVGLYILILSWQYYYGVIDHSGIMFESIWPWQPTVKYHDYHHKCFHVNLGFNLYLFDWLHDTNYKGDRVYTEETFIGDEKQKKRK